MTTSLWIFVLALLSYLLGAIPFGLLFAWAKGVDIRTVGSCNIGATNVFRSVSKTLGILTFILDALKGLAPALLFPKVVMWAGQGEPALWLGLLFGASAIIGHTWPVYIGFKGGKGVATSAGALIGIAPAAAGIGLLTWALLFAATRYVSVASIAAALVVPVAGWWRYRGQGVALPIALTALGLLIVWRHKKNIQRLVNGTEHRFGKARAAEQQKPQ